jgi:hypothetical protein
MSARRWWTAVVLAAVLVVAAGGSARAQTVVARIGGQLVGRPGQPIDVPVTVDLSGAPGVSLGSYRGEIRFDPSALEFTGNVFAGTFAAPLVNSDSAGLGVVKFTAVLPAGAPGPVVTLFVARFYVPYPDTTATALTLSFDEMSAAGMPFTNLLPHLQAIQPATLCPSLGSWGDVDLDGNTNSRDALIALSRVVGIALDTAYTDSLSHQTYVTMRPGLADVDGDGRVSSRDALIIVSYAVGLPVTGYRIGLAAAGACGTTTGVALRITPDTLELQSAQTISVSLTARDSTGRSVAVNDIRWSSSNPAVAAALVTYSGVPQVVARDSGWAIISAEVGVGYRASAVVHVIARRSQWYVDIVRAGQTTLESQAGDRRLPFAYIQDALNAARDLDTINVAYGIYPEVVSSDLSVFLRGDTLSRPVIDPRGADYFYGGPALNLGSRVGLLRIENFRVVGGGVEAYARSFVGRNLRIDSVRAGEGGNSASLYFESTPAMPPGGAPPAGVQLGGVPYDTGSVFLDGIDVRGFLQRGIYVRAADSVVILHSTVQGDPDFPNYVYCGTSPGVEGGIVVDEAAYSRLSSNTVSDAKCASIAVFQTGGEAWVSGNRVARVGGVGILASAPHVAFDHNAVRDVRSPNYDGSSWDGRQSAGIRVSNWNRVQSVSSLADTVRHVGAAGFLVDTTGTALIDSLVVDSTGIDEVSYAHGAALYSGSFTVRNARISNVRYDDAVSVCGPSAALFSRGNHVTGSGHHGISSTDCFNYYPTDGPDTLVSVRDTVDIPATSTWTGIYSEYAKYARVDSAVVSGTGPNGATGIAFGNVDITVLRDSRVSDIGYYGVDISRGVRALLERNTITSIDSGGVYFDGVDSTVLRDSRISNTGWEGVYLYGGSAALFERDTIESTGLEGWEGLYLDGPTDTIRVRQTVVLNSGSSGIGMWGAVIRADTIAVTNSLNVSSGLSFDGGSGGRVTGSRLEGNSNFGVHVYYANPQGFVTLDSLNSLADNANGGVNYESDGGPQLYAEGNWWGSEFGPEWYPEVGGPLAIYGDVDFANFLTVPPTFPLAPRVQLAGAVRPVGAAVARGAEGSVERQRPGHDARHAARAARRQATRSAQTALRPAVRPQHPTTVTAPQPVRPPLMSYRRGAPPRPAVVHHPQ